MKSVLIFSGGALTMAATYSWLHPLCNLSNAFAGFCIGVVGIGLAVIVGGRG